MARAPLAGRSTFVVPRPDGCAKKKNPGREAGVRFEAIESAA
jgi:hypothetical protein